jgi:hypothetical protein
VEPNPGLKVKQKVFDKIIEYVWNQEKESEGIRNLLGTHKQEVKGIKGTYQDLWPEFDKC